MWYPALATVTQAGSGTRRQGRLVTQAARGQDGPCPSKDKYRVFRPADYQRFQWSKGIHRGAGECGLIANL